MIGLQKADSQVVQNGRLVQVTKSCEVILSDQDVRVTQKGERVLLGANGILQRLEIQNIKMSKLNLHVLTAIKRHEYYCYTVSSSSLRCKMDSPSL